MVIDLTNSADLVLLQPLADLIQPLILKLSLLVGGLFGLYLIFIIIKTYYERKRTLILQDILYDLDQLNIHYGIPHSDTKPRFFQRWRSTLPEKHRKR